MSKEELENKVLASLEELRPFLVADGGDISLVEITDDLTARVQWHGACVNCNMSAMTMKAGVEEAIKKAAPMIRKVEAVRNEN
jgi:Fe-S cluster biogenesis protein NfuA